MFEFVRCDDERREGKKGGVQGGVSRAGVPTMSIGNAAGEVGAEGRGRFDRSDERSGKRGAEAEGDEAICDGGGGERREAAPHEACSLDTW